MLKILGVCGSPRKKSTYTALDHFLKTAEAEGGVETELVELRGKKLNFCIHCNKCVKEGNTHCPVYKTDDMDPLYDKLYEADAFVAASPVYEMGITAQLATFFNRFRPTWSMVSKDPYFFARKVACALTVGGTRNGGQEGAINGMMGFFHTQGYTICNGGSGVYGGASLWSPGDGSGTMDDPYGLERVEILAKKLVYTTKKMNGIPVEEGEVYNALTSGK